MPQNGRGSCFTQLPVHAVFSHRKAPISPPCYPGFVLIGLWCFHAPIGPILRVLNTALVVLVLADIIRFRSKRFEVSTIPHSPSQEGQRLTFFPLESL